MKPNSLIPLTTPFEEELNNCEIPFNKYPRPQLIRDSYLCLNGKWRFTVLNNSTSIYSSEIVVPFPPESRISGVERKICKNDVMVYERQFTLPDSFLKDKVILHIGACDQYSTVFVNGSVAGSNVGGYLPFSFDITDKLKSGINNLKITVTDNLDKNLPYGKQTLRRGGMWYTKTSGIWQTVWLESVTDDYVKSLKITPTLNNITLEVNSDCEDKALIIEDGEKPLKYIFKGSKITVNIENPKHWTPENPYLYNFTVISGKDTVKSYFALRELSIKKVNDTPLLCLNGKPYFFNGVLDQGYFSDGIFTPATPEGYKNDILKMKACGFNTLRKHIKLEPQLFYYYCDKYGMAVFQDFINSGSYSFLIDTALPTVFLKRGITHTASKKRKSEFYKTSEGIMSLLYNNPSVLCYTIFNEGWGQFDANNCYRHFKGLDSTRVYDTASGWFKTKLSDFKSEHIYFKPIKLKKDKALPLFLSEFGGYSYKVAGHSANADKTYGYRFYNSAEDFADALLKLYEDEIFPHINIGLNATVLTQLSDVEDETNGILTYNRKICKLDPEKLSEISVMLREKFNSKWIL